MRAEIEKKLKYKFRDGALLERAFTHSSAPSGKPDYQSLEFLGDSVLSFVVSKRLFAAHPSANEGKLTKMRACVVSAEPLAEAVRALGISGYIVAGEHEIEHGLRENNSILCDIYEAVTAAIFLDGGMGAAEDFIVRTLGSVIGSASSAIKKADAKSRLNEYALKHGTTATYRETAREGSPENPVFEFEAVLGDKVMGSGRGATKREAQQIAAQKALDKLTKA